MKIVKTHHNDYLGICLSKKKSIASSQ